MKKFVKICLISFLLFGVFSTILAGSFVGIEYLKFQKLPLSAEALSEPSLSVSIFTAENRPMKEENQFNGDFCALEDLPQHTKDAFLAIEDKNFYQHHGLNYKRMAGAMLQNIKSHRLKEGASTISQQLIKNTHLSGEKTLSRKLKEVALTKKLEKAFDKDSILESYLNIIFFGNNCYGIESAARYYFSKSAKDLSLAESATLAGIIKAPSKYSPITNPQNCLARRNLVLAEMEKDSRIDVDQKLQAQQSPLALHIQPRSHNRLNSYSQSALDEAAQILGITPKQVAIGGYHIHTYQNSDKQAALESSLQAHPAENLDTAAIVINNQTHGVSAFCGSSNFKILDCPRQPASTIKPLLVYGPALNENIISPSTQILDEKITIGGYSPSNVNKKYAGYVSVTDAVKNSINIPAIKVLSYIGIDTGKAYAQKIGISFDAQDDSYALALGGMTQGINLQTLANAYTVFANGGTYDGSTFVQYITDKNNKLVYVHKPAPKMVLREDSAYLMTSILQETARTGTARKLKDIKNTQIASKTGTVGKKNQSGNTDAYNISFTPQETIGVWYGNLQNLPCQIAGGNQPTAVVADYVSAQTYEKTEFDAPSSVTDAKIDLLELENNHRVVLASPFAPERYTKTALFSRFNMPQEISENFTQKPQINATAKVENGQIVLTIPAQKHLCYQIFKDGAPHQTIRDKCSPVTLCLPFSKNTCTVKIVATYATSGEDQTSTTLSTPKNPWSEQEFHLKKTTQTTSPTKEKWYI